MTDAAKPDPVDVHVGNAIRARRRKVAMSQEALAEALEVSPQQIQKYERAESRISASKLFKVSQALRAPIAHFFSGLDDQQYDNYAAEMEANLSNLLRSTEGQELAELFPLVEDIAVRRQVVELLRAMTHQAALARK